MQLNFYFILHPSEWTSVEEGEAVYSAQYAGYQIYNVYDPTTGKTNAMDLEYVKVQIRKKRWIMTDENGNYGLERNK